MNYILLIPALKELARGNYREFLKRVPNELSDGLIAFIIAEATKKAGVRDKDLQRITDVVDEIGKLFKR